MSYVPPPTDREEVVIKEFIARLRDQDKVERQDAVSQGKKTPRELPKDDVAIRKQILGYHAKMDELSFFTFLTGPVAVNEVLKGVRGAVKSEEDIGPKVERGPAAATTAPQPKGAAAAPQPKGAAAAPQPKKEGFFAKLMRRQREAAQNQQSTTRDQSTGKLFTPAADTLGAQERPSPEDVRADLLDQGIRLIKNIQITITDERARIIKLIKRSDADNQFLELTEPSKWDGRKILAAAREQGIKSGDTPTPEQVRALFVKKGEPGLVQEPDKDKGYRP